MEEEIQNIRFEPEFVGRKKEVNRLIDIFEDVKEEKGSTIFISGEAGIGKTRLVEEFKERCFDEDDMIFLRGSCLHESMDPLLPIKEAFRERHLQHIISGDPPPKVISTYLIDNNGLLISKAERKESDLDADIFASMLENIESFVQDSLSKMGRDDDGTALNTIGYGKYNILIQYGERYSLAAIIEGTKDEFLIDDMKERLSEAENNLPSWQGDMSETEKVESQISWFTNTNKYNGEFLVDDPEVKRENLFENVLLGLRRIAYEKPVILFLDDLQWADQYTLLLLHYLSRNTKESKILILCTYRPEDIVKDDEGEEHRFKRIKQKMSREELYEELKLERLTKEDTEKIVDYILGEIDKKDDFLKVIDEEAEGNPFFILEIVNLLIEEDFLIKKDEEWILEENVDDLDVPSRVHDVIERRIDKLSKDQRKILSCGSVEGEKFSSRVVREVLDIERLTLLEDLNEIEKRYKLINSSDDRYEFDHGTIREVLYDDMNKQLCKEYHRAIAETYENMASGETDENLEAIAHHYYKADDKRGIDYLIEAAEKAADHYANEEAIDFYGKTLSLIGEGEKEEKKRASEGMGKVQQLIGKYDEAINNYKTALEIATEDKEKADLYSKIAEVLRVKGDYERSLKYVEDGLSLVGEDDIETARLLNKQGWVLFRIGEYDKAIDVFKEEKILAERLGDDKERGQAVHDLGSSHFMKGDYERSEDFMKKAIKVREDIEDTKGLSDSFNSMAGIYWRKGEIDRALEYFERSLEIKEEIGKRSRTAGVLNNIGLIYQHKGDLDKALEYHRKSLDIQREIGQKSITGPTLNGLGNIYHRKGDLSKALETYKKALDISEEVGEEKVSVLNLCGIAEVWIDKGDIEKAEENAKKALNTAYDNNLKIEIGLAQKVMGMIFGEKGEWERSMNRFDKGLEILKKVGVKADLAETYYQYGKMLKVKGEKERAEQKLKKGLSMFEDMGMEIWKKKTKEALEELG